MKTLEIQLEELEKMRAKWLLVNLVGFVFWDGFRIANNYLIEGGISTMLLIVYGLGWLTWVIGLVQLSRLSTKVKKTKLASQVLNDELVEFNRLKAWRVALFAVILTQVVVIVSNFLSVEVSGILSAEITVFVGVVSAITAFLYYDQSVANG